MMVEMGYGKGKSRLRADIDANLKKVYDEVLKEDVPDRFKELLERLREAGKPTDDPS